MVVTIIMTIMTIIIVANIITIMTMMMAMMGGYEDTLYMTGSAVLLYRACLAMVVIYLV